MGLLLMFFELKLMYLTYSELMKSVFLFPSCVPQGFDGHVECCVVDTLLLDLKQYYPNCQILLHEFDSYVMVSLRVNQYNYISDTLLQDFSLIQ